MNAGMLMPELACSLPMPSFGLLAHWYGSIVAPSLVEPFEPVSKKTNSYQNNSSYNLCYTYSYFICAGMQPVLRASHGLHNHIHLGIVFSLICNSI